MGIGGGIITKKLLFVALLIASLSLGGITAASAADVSATQIQTSNTNTLNKDINTQSNSTNILKNSTKTQNSVDKSVKEVNKTSDKKKVTRQNVNNVKTNDATISQSSTNVQKSKNVVKQESTVSSSSTVSQTTVNDTRTTINVQNTNTVNVSTTNTENQNSVQNTSNVNDVKINADNTSAISETTNNTTQTSSQPNTTDSKTGGTSNQTTTINVPETNTNVSSGNNTTTPTTNQSTVTTTPKTDNTTDQYSAAAGDTVTPTFTVDQIKDAASRVKAYVETYKKTPDYITIGSYQVDMSDFLKLLTACLLQLNNGNSTPISIKSVNAPTQYIESVTSGNIIKTDYLDLAKRVNDYIDKYGAAPNYANSPLGKLRGENLIYIFSKILNFQKINNYLPNYVTVKPWTSIESSGGSTSTGESIPIPASLQQYLVPTANAQSNNGQIYELAHQLCGGRNDMNAAVSIFNWVRDNLSYSFYYNTQYGAVGALNARTGNCVDTAHLVVALARSAGIPAKYEHVYAQFSSGNWYGHVVAYLWVNGVWYIADATSNYNSFGSISNWNYGTATFYGSYASLPF